MARLGSKMARLLHHDEADTNLWELHNPGHQRQTNLSDLPEDWLSLILSFTAPRDICMLSLVSKFFKSAAYSDTVWSKFIPQQCQQILARSVEPVAYASQRALYFHLCDSILIDGGRKRFWVERSTAKSGYMLAARELTIGPGIWRWVSGNDSRFEEVARLTVVFRMEVRGRIDCGLLSPGSKYSVLFVLKLGEYAQGWNRRPVKFSVTTPGGQVMESEQLLMETPRQEEEEENPRWFEMAAGEFTVSATDSSYIEFCMKEVEWGHLKTGLYIDGVTVQPKS